MSKSKSLILRVYTNVWAGNVDGAVQAAIFGVCDDRYGSKNGLDMLIRYRADDLDGSYDPSVNLEDVLEGHPSNDSDLAYDCSIYYDVSVDENVVPGSSSYVEFYLTEPLTTAQMKELHRRLCWYRDNEEMIVDFRLTLCTTVTIVQGEEIWGIQPK